jgi:hypothetical protein
MIPKPIFPIELSQIIAALFAERGFPREARAKPNQVWYVGREEITALMPTTFSRLSRAAAFVAVACATFFATSSLEARERARKAGGGGDRERATSRTNAAGETATDGGSRDPHAFPRFDHHPPRRPHGHALAVERADRDRPQHDRSRHHGQRRHREVRFQYRPPGQQLHAAGDGHRPGRADRIQISGSHSHEHGRHPHRHHHRTAGHHQVRDEHRNPEALTLSSGSHFRHRPKNTVGPILALLPQGFAPAVGPP